MAALVSGSFGFTDCDQFSSVTVPYADTTPPMAVSGLWRNGAYLSMVTDATALDYPLDNGRGVLAVATAFDPEGASTVSLRWFSMWQCCYVHDDGDPSQCSPAQWTSGSTSASQPGGPGAHVANGVYQFVTLPQPVCTLDPEAPDPFRVVFWFQTTATNFFGGTSTSPWLRAHYADAAQCPSGGC